MNKWYKIILSLTTLLIAIGSVVSPTLVWGQEEQYRFKLHLMTGTELPPAQMAGVELVAEYLRDIGIDVEIHTVEKTRVRRNDYKKTWDEGGYDICSISFGMMASEMLWYTGCFASYATYPNGWNWAAWQNGLADYYLQQAETTMNKTERMELYRKWQQTYMEDPSYIWTHYPKGRMALVEELDVYAPPLPYDAKGFHEQFWTVSGRSPPISVTIADPALPEAFNPMFLQGDLYPTGPIFNALMESRYDKATGTFSITPILAESYEVSEDGRSIIFNLRKGVTWHDGEEFTAEDVKFTFDAVLDPNTGSTSYAEVASKVRSVEVIDKYTVQFNLLEASPLTFISMMKYGTSILPKHIFEDVPHSELATDLSNTGEDINRIIGTGPFKIVEYVPEGHVTLEANPDYFEGKPEIDYLIFKFIMEKASAIAALEKGEVDLLIHTITTEDADRLSGISGLKVLYYDQPTMLGFSINCYHPILQNRYVRLALNYAVDREEYLQLVEGGVGEIARTPITPVHWPYDSTIKPFPYDPEYAKQLLDKAGYPMPEEVVTPNPLYTYILPSAIGGLIVGIVLGGIVSSVLKRK